MATDTYDLYRDLGNTWVNITSQQIISHPLPDTGVTPGTYDRVTVNSKGQVIVGFISDFVHDRFKFQSATAGVHHTVTHNLNTLSIEVNVSVENDDHTWSNDIVKINILDENTVDVWLTEARRILANIIKLD